MQFAGWNMEKTLLIESRSRLPARELVDVSIPVETVAASNLARDVRVALKTEWNKIEREIPAQVYAIRNFGAVTTCRVAFYLDVPADGVQRVGIFYDHPSAPAPNWTSPLDLRVNGGLRTLSAPQYSLETADHLGLFRNLIARHEPPNFDARIIRCVDHAQDGTQVIFAVQDGDRVRPVTGSAANWQSPTWVEDHHGPIFAKWVRRGLLQPDPSWPLKRCPELTLGCKFFAGDNFFLVHSRLEFPAETPVFGLFSGLLQVERARYTHYTFRPVSPELPNTDIEEMGHILIDPAHTGDLPHGEASAGLLPFNLAWHGFINTRKGSEWALAALQLEHRITAPDGAFPQYRAAGYLTRDPEMAACFRAPIYVQRRDRPENIIRIPAGAVVESLEAWVLDHFDSGWGDRIDALGRRLNNPPQIRLHPQFIAGPVPPEPFEPLPYGRRSDAYTRHGVR